MLPPRAKPQALANGMTFAGRCRAPA